MSRLPISNKIIGLGDSHLDLFTYFCNATCRIPGATAYGLTSLTSETSARQGFLNFLASFPTQIPLLCIGEVDCNSLPWRAEITTDPHQVIHNSVNNLFTFISETNRKFILPSVTLPPVESYKDLSIRKHVPSSKLERTLLVNLYNKLLKEKSLKLGHYYIDITSPTTDTLGFVHQDYIISPIDVHLSSYKMHNIIRSTISSLGIPND
jgi:hypothetical protein